VPSAIGGYVQIDPELLSQSGGQSIFGESVRSILPPAPDICRFGRVDGASVYSGGGFSEAQSSMTYEQRVEFYKKVPSVSDREARLHVVEEAGCGPAVVEDHGPSEERDVDTEYHIRKMQRAIRSGGASHGIIHLRDFPTALLDSGTRTELIERISAVPLTAVVAVNNGTPTRFLPPDSVDSSEFGSVWYEYSNAPVFVDRCRALPKPDSEYGFLVVCDCSKTPCRSLCTASVARDGELCPECPGEFAFVHRHEEALESMMCEWKVCVRSGVEPPVALRDNPHEMDPLVVHNDTGDPGDNCEEWKSKDQQDPMLKPAHDSGRFALQYCDIDTAKERRALYGYTFEEALQDCEGGRVALDHILHNKGSLPVKPMAGPCYFESVAAYWARYSELAYRWCNINRQQSATGFRGKPRSGGPSRKEGIFEFDLSKCVVIKTAPCGVDTMIADCEQIFFKIDGEYYVAGRVKDPKGKDHKFHIPSVDRVVSRLQSGEAFEFYGTPADPTSDKVLEALRTGPHEWPCIGSLADPRGVYGCEEAEAMFGGIGPPALRGDLVQQVCQQMSVGDIVVIQGPFGTGKSRYTATALVDLVQKCKFKPIFCAAQNKALLSVVKRLIRMQSLRIVRFCSEAYLDAGGEETRCDFHIIMEQLANENNSGRTLATEYVEARRRMLAEKKKRKPSEKVMKRYQKVKAKAVDLAVESAEVILVTIGNLHTIPPEVGDIVIVDEAGQMAEILMFLVFMRAKRVVMMGDHKQLPPVIMSSEGRNVVKNTLDWKIPVYDLVPDTSGWRDLDASDELEVSLLERIFRAQRSRPLVLEMQYRIDRRVAAFLSAYVYEGMLRSASQAPSEAQYRNARMISGDETKRFDKGDGPAIFHYQVEADVLTKRPDNDPGAEVYDSPNSVAACQEIIANLVSQGVGKEHITILTSYRITPCMARRLKPLGVTFISVGAGQGMEAQVIIWLVMATKNGGTSFICDPRRFNVAMSRFNSLMFAVYDRRAADVARNKSGTRIFGYLDAFINSVGCSVDSQQSLAEKLSIEGIIKDDVTTVPTATDKCLILPTALALMAEDPRYSPSAAEPSYGVSKTARVDGQYTVEIEPRDYVKLLYNGGRLHSGSTDYITDLDDLMFFDYCDYSGECTDERLAACCNNADDKRAETALEAAARRDDSIPMSRIDNQLFGALKYREEVWYGDVSMVFETANGCSIWCGGPLSCGPHGRDGTHLGKIDAMFHTVVDCTTNCAVECGAARRIPCVIRSEPGAEQRNIQAIRRCIRILLRYLQKGERVLIVCGTGMRKCGVVAYVLALTIEGGDFGPSDAWQQMVKVRPCLSYSFGDLSRFFERHLVGANRVRALEEQDRIEQHFRASSTRPALRPGGDPPLTRVCPARPARTGNARFQPQSAIPARASYTYNLCLYQYNCDSLPKFIENRPDHYAKIVREHRATITTWIEGKTNAATEEACRKILAVDGMNTTFLSNLSTHEAKGQHGQAVSIPVESEWDIRLDRGPHIEGRIGFIEAYQWQGIHLYAQHRKDVGKAQVWDRQLDGCISERKKLCKKPLVVYGDLNICPEKRDSSPFVGEIPCVRDKEDIAVLQALMRKHGLVDVWRVLHPDAEGHYTSFYQLDGCLNRNWGSRIDLFLVDERMMQFVRGCEIVYDIHKSIGDHRPVYLDLFIPGDILYCNIATKCEFQSLAENDALLSYADANMTRSSGTRIIEDNDSSVVWAVETTAPRERLRNIQRCVSSSYQRYDRDQHELFGPSQELIAQLYTPFCASSVECEYDDEGSEGEAGSDGEQDEVASVAEERPGSERAPVDKEQFIATFVEWYEKYAAEYVDKDGALGMFITKWSDPKEAARHAGSVVFHHLMMDDSSMGFKSIADGLLKFMIDCGCAQIVGCKFGAEKSKLFTSICKACGYCFSSGAKAVPQSRINQILSWSIIVESAKELRTRLGVMAFVPQAFDLSYSRITGRLTKYMNKTGAAFTALYRDLEAIRALRLIRLSTGVNPLDPLPVDDILQGKRILIEMTDGHLVGWGAIVFTILKAAFLSNDPKYQSAEEIRASVRVHFIKSHPFPADMRDLEGAIAEALANVGLYQFIDHQIATLPRVLVNDCKRLRLLEKAMHKCTARAFMGTLSIVGRFFAQPNLERLLASGALIFLGDRSSRDHRNCTLARSVFQEQLCDVNSFLIKLWPHLDPARWDENIDDDDTAVAARASMGCAGGTEEVVFETGSDDDVGWDEQLRIGHDWEGCDLHPDDVVDAWPNECAMRALGMYGDGFLDEADTGGSGRFSNIAEGDGTEVRHYHVPPRGEFEQLVGGLRAKLAGSEDPNGECNFIDEYYDCFDNGFTRRGVTIRKRIINDDRGVYCRESWALFDPQQRLNGNKRVDSFEEIVTILNRALAQHLEKQQILGDGHGYRGASRVLVCTRGAPLAIILAFEYERNVYLEQTQAVVDFSFEAKVTRWKPASYSPNNGRFDIDDPLGLSRWRTVISVKQITYGKDTVDDLVVALGISRLESCTSPFREGLSLIDPNRLLVLGDPHEEGDPVSGGGFSAGKRVAEKVPEMSENAKRIQRVRERLLSPETSSDEVTPAVNPDVAGPSGSAGSGDAGSGSEGLADVPEHHFIGDESDAGESPPVEDPGAIVPADIAGNALDRVSLQERDLGRAALQQYRQRAEECAKQPNSNDILKLYEALYNDEFMDYPAYLKQLARDKGQRALTDEEILHLHKYDNHRAGGPLSNMLVIAGYINVGVDRINKIIKEKCTCMSSLFRSGRESKKECLRIPSEREWEVDQFYLPPPGTPHVCAIANMPEADDWRNGAKEGKRHPKSIRLRQIANGYRICCTRPSDAIPVLNHLLAAELAFGKVRPTLINVSDSEARGVETSSFVSIGTDVPVRAFYAPNDSTAIVSTTQYMSRAIWGELSGFFLEHNIDELSACLILDSYLNLVPASGVQVWKLKPGKESRFLLDRAILGLHELLMARMFLRPKVQRMLRRQMRDQFGLMPPADVEKYSEGNFVVPFKHQKHQWQEGELGGMRRVITVYAGGRGYCVKPSHVLWPRASYYGENIEKKYPVSYFAIYHEEKAAVLATLVGDWDSYSVPRQLDDVADGKVPDSALNALRGAVLCDHFRVRNAQGNCVAMRAMAHGEPEIFSLTKHCHDDLQHIICMSRHVYKGPNKPQLFYGKKCPFTYYDTFQDGDGKTVCGPERDCIYWQWNGAKNIVARIWIRSVDGDAWVGNSKFHHGGVSPWCSSFRTLVLEDDHRPPDDVPVLTRVAPTVRSLPLTDALRTLGRMCQIARHIDILPGVDGCDSVSITPTTIPDMGLVSITDEGSVIRWRDNSDLLRCGAASVGCIQTWLDMPDEKSRILFARDIVGPHSFYNEEINAEDYFLAVEGRIELWHAVEFLADYTAGFAKTVPTALGGGVCSLWVRSQKEVVSGEEAIEEYTCDVVVHSVTRSGDIAVSERACEEAAARMNSTTRRVSDIATALACFESHERAPSQSTFAAGRLYAAFGEALTSLDGTETGCGSDRKEINLIAQNTTDGCCEAKYVLAQSVCEGDVISEAAMIADCVEAHYIGKGHDTTGVYIKDRAMALLASPDAPDTPPEGITIEEAAKFWVAMISILMDTGDLSGPPVDLTGALQVLKQLALVAEAAVLESSMKGRFEQRQSICHGSIDERLFDTAVRAGLLEVKLPPGREHHVSGFTGGVRDKNPRILRCRLYFMDRRTGRLHLSPPMLLYRVPGWQCNVPQWENLHIALGNFDLGKFRHRQHPLYHEVEFGLRHILDDGGQHSWCVRVAPYIVFDRTTRMYRNVAGFSNSLASSEHQNEGGGEISYLSLSPGDICRAECIAPFPENTECIIQLVASDEARVAITLHGHVIPAFAVVGPSRRLSFEVVAQKQCRIANNTFTVLIRALNGDEGTASARLAKQAAGDDKEDDVAVPLTVGEARKKRRKKKAKPSGAEHETRVVNINNDASTQGLQGSEAKGAAWVAQKPESRVYIGRPSRFGNPFVLGPEMGRPEACAKYREHVLQSPALMAQLDALKGKELGCFCAPAQCHGDVLVELICQQTPGGGEVGGSRAVEDAVAGGFLQSVCDNINSRFLRAGDGSCMELTPDVLEKCREEHRFFLQQRAAYKPNDPRFLGSLLYTWVRNLDMSVLGRTQAEINESIRLLTIVLLGILPVHGHACFMGEGMPTPKFKNGYTDTRVLSFSKPIRAMPRRVHCTPEEDEVFQMLAEQDVINEIIEEFDVQKHGFLRFVSNTGRTKRGNRALGRYYQAYFGPNEISGGVYVYSIIPKQIMSFLQVDGIIGYHENDIKRAFAGLTPSDALRVWLALHIGSKVFVPVAGTPGFAPYPGIFGQCTSIFNAARSGPAAADAFLKEVSSICVKEVPNFVRYGLGLDSCFCRSVGSDSN